MEDKATEKKQNYENLSDIPAERFKEIVLKSMLFDENDMVNEIRVISDGALSLFLCMDKSSIITDEEKSAIASCKRMVGLIGMFYDEINGMEVSHE